MACNENETAEFEMSDLFDEGSTAQAVPNQNISDSQRISEAEEKLRKLRAELGLPPAPPLPSTESTAIGLTPATEHVDVTIQTEKKSEMNSQNRPNLQNELMQVQPISIRRHSLSVPIQNELMQNRPVHARRISMSVPMETIEEEYEPMDIENINPNIQK